MNALAYNCSDSLPIEFFTSKSPIHFVKCLITEFTEKTASKKRAPYR